MAARQRGAEKIASLWADSRKVPQVAFKPDWTKHAKAAPFKRNDQMLNVCRSGGDLPRHRHSGQSGRQGLQDGHPVYRFGSGGA